MESNPTRDAREKETVQSSHRIDLWPSIFRLRPRDVGSWGKKSDQRGDIDDRPHARRRIVVREDTLGNDEREPSDRTLIINFFAFFFVGVLRQWKKRNRRSNGIAVSLFIPRRSNVLFSYFFLWILIIRLSLHLSA